VEGKDLKRVMEYYRVRGRPMPMPEALYVMRRTCEALDYAHNCRNSQGQPMNIVHRDISPQNVLVSYGGDVKLIDFGIAKTTGRLTETVAGSIKGKFGYMSPEQVSGKPVDLRSDIFACGTVLWELLTNTRLFKSETDIITMQMVRRAEINPPSSVNPAVPPALDRIVLRALARDPAHRYQNAGELLDDLERFIVESGNSCSSQHLARWMNDVFEQDRLQAEQRQRMLAASAPLTEEGHNTLSAPRPSLEIVDPQRFASIPPQPTKTVTGQATVTGSYTETEYVMVSSHKPWIVVGILVVLLITGGVLVLTLWPRSSVMKVVVPSTPTVVHTSALADDAGHRRAPVGDLRAPSPPVATTQPPAPHRPRHIPRHHHRVRAPVPPVTPPTEAPLRPPPTPAAGRLLVASKPWARVWIDGRDTGRNTPIPAGAPLVLAPGSHRVTLYVNERRFDFRVTVTAGETAKLIQNLPITR